MSKKRFKIVWECLEDSSEFSDDYEETTFGVSEVVDRLNELAEDVEKWKDKYFELYFKYENPPKELDYE